MICGHSVAKFGDDRALEATRENEVKSNLRKVIDKASGKNLVMTGSVQVTSFHSI
jgi:hypothetical protein